jgi:hypothetical protein
VDEQAARNPQTTRPIAAAATRGSRSRRMGNSMAVVTRSR